MGRKGSEGEEWQEGQPAHASTASETVGAELDPSLLRDIPLCLHPEKKKCFVVTYVVLGQTVPHLSNLFLIHGKRRKTQKSRRKAAQEKSICFHFIWSLTLEDDQVHSL